MEGIHEVAWSSSDSVFNAGTETESSYYSFTKKGSSKIRIKLSSSKNMVPYFSRYFEISIP